MIVKFFLIITLSLITAVKSVEITCEIKDITFNSTEVVSTCVSSQFDIIFNNETSTTNKINQNARGLIVENSTTSYLPLNLNEIFPHIEYLVYKESKLKNIQNNSLIGLHKLIDVSFHRNQLHTIENNTFIDNEMIKKLTLSSNEIKSIEADALKELRMLREVYLSDNEIEIVSEVIFSSNVELRVIKLDNNNLKSLPITIFDGLQSLVELTLDFNYIDELPGRIFRDNKELKIFTISNNKLKLIGSENLVIFESLEGHNFLNNPCTEDLDRSYDFDDLKNIIDEKCNAECEAKYKWLSKELKEIGRAKRGTTHIDENYINNILKEMQIDADEKIRIQINTLTEHIQQNYAKNEELSRKMQELSATKVNQAENIEKSGKNDEIKNLKNELMRKIENLERLYDDVSEKSNNNERDLQNQVNQIKQRYSDDNTRNIELNRDVDVLKREIQFLKQENADKLTKLEKNYNNLMSKNQQNYEELKSEISRNFKALELREYESLRVKEIKKMENSN